MFQNSIWNCFLTQNVCAGIASFPSLVSPFSFPEMEFKEFEPRSKSAKIRQNPGLNLVPA